MAWRTAAVIILSADGAYLDADRPALDLLGVASVEELRASPPDRFAASPPDPDEQEAWRQAYFATAAQGVLAEGAFRRSDGELVRVRTAISAEPDGTYRALFYPVERPTTNLVPRLYRIGDILAEWRSAERLLIDVDPDSDEGLALAADIELLRDQYQQLFHRSFGART